VESLNGTLRDELLNGEIFYTVAEVRVLIERCAKVSPFSATAFVLVGHSFDEGLGVHGALRGTRLEPIGCLCEAESATRGHPDAGTRANFS
jgi:hypothetical protein